MRDGQTAWLRLKIIGSNSATPAEANKKENGHKMIIAMSLSTIVRPCCDKGAPPGPSLLPTRKALTDSLEITLGVSGGNKISSFIESRSKAAAAAPSQNLV